MRIFDANGDATDKSAIDNVTACNQSREHLYDQLLPMVQPCTELTFDIRHLGE